MRTFKPKLLFVIYHASYGPSTFGFGNVVTGHREPRNMDDLNVIRDDVMKHLSDQGMKPTALVIINFRTMPA